MSGESVNSWQQVFPFHSAGVQDYLNDLLFIPDALLMGKRTYEFFAQVWPTRQGTDADRRVWVSPLTKPPNMSPRVGPCNLHGDKSVLLQGDVMEATRKLKAQDGPELQVHGSGNLIQALLKHDLVDELWLKIFPITLGVGKRLFADGTIPAAFTLVESKPSPMGVVVASCKRAGEVKVGSF